ncbi:MAG: metallophosphoesterase [Agriterribacter sp.]
MKLEIGYNQSFEIRKEIYPAKSQENFDILFLSDLHFNGFTKGMISKIASAIHELNPSIILFGGDYIDSKKGLNYLKDLLSSISDRDNMFAIAGNHDYFFGIDKVEETFLANNVKWIEKKSTTLNIKNIKIRIDGNIVCKRTRNEDFSILLLHKPKQLEQFKDYYNIAFAGHLHGCQFVFWRSGNNLYPGRLIYKNNFLKHRQADCDYFISKGAGDAVPVRYNCKRDILLLQVTNSNTKTTAQ